MKRSLRSPSPRSAPARSPRAQRRKLALVSVGVALVVTGVLLGLIPVIPGTPLVLLGVGMVATHSARGRWLRWRAVSWLRRRGLPTGPLERRSRRSRRHTTATPRLERPTTTTRSAA